MAIDTHLPTLSLSPDSNPIHNHNTRTKQHPYTHTELSCASARVPAPSTLDFCAPIVTWRAAAVYAHINYTVRHVWG